MNRYAGLFTMGILVAALLAGCGSTGTDGSKAALSSASRIESRSDGRDRDTGESGVNNAVSAVQNASQFGSNTESEAEVTDKEDLR